MCALDIDPNAIEGVLLGPIPGDPNVWTVQAGKFQRTALACHPNGYPIDVNLVSSTADDAQVSYDLASGTWTLVAELPPGLHVFVVKAVDSPLYGESKERWVTIVLEALPPENHGPVLCTLGFLGLLTARVRWVRKGMKL